MSSTTPALKLLRGDITKLAVSAIVNAANNSLLGGGGVDGAIHRAAGVELLKYCRTLDGCETGEAVVTPGFNLPAKHIIHTVGPIWYGGESNEANLLRSCYRNTLKCADQLDAKTLAYPALSTGIYGFPLEEATRIAVDTVRQTSTKVESVTFVAFDERTFDMYNSVLSQHSNNTSDDTS